MAYENYNFVSWSDGSPVSSNRLGQMSTNIEQVKDVVDDKAQGILQLNQATSQFPNSTGYSDFTQHEIIALKDESSSPGGADRRVTIAANRYYKITVNIPAITIKNKGAEDSKFVIDIYDGIDLSDPNWDKIGSWEITPHTYTFINPVSNVETIKTANTFPTKIAAGTYSIVKTTSNAEINKSFFVTVSRNSGSNTDSAPNWLVEANSASPLQFYVEDVGGI